MCLYRFRIGIQLLICLSLLSVPASVSGNSALQEQIPGSSILAKIFYSNQAELTRLVENFDVWEVQPANGSVLALISTADYSQLFNSSYRIEIDRDRTLQLNRPRSSLAGQEAGIPGFPCYRTVEETYEDLARIAAEHPELASWIDIGDSWEKTQPGGLPGYDLNTLVLSNHAVAGPKPRFFLLGAIHAREYATAETAARIAETLASQYGSDADITWLLDHYEAHILPILNPDGRKLAENGKYWRKNTDNNNGCTDPAAWGTDLNRNSSYHWGGASSNACAETYQGPSAQSEPEIQALLDYQTSIFTDQRGAGEGDAAPVDASGIFVSLHSYGELVLWPWGDTGLPAPNGAQLATLGRKLAFFNRYAPIQAVSLYPVTGSTDDWVYGELGVASYSFELGTDFFQDCESFQSRIYPDNLQSLLYAFKAARQPYLAPSGPDTMDVAVTKTVVAPGQPVVITATATDNRYWPIEEEPFQSIAAARFSLDLPSWSDGAVIYPMGAADGQFDAVTEKLQAILDTTAIPPGKHILFLESQDSNGIWGVPSAVFFTVDASAPALWPVFIPFMKK